MTRDQTLQVARELYTDYLATGNHNYVVQVYNSIRPLPRGYALKKTDAWCAAWVSALGHLAKMGEKWVYECSAPQMLAAWRKRRMARTDFENMEPGDLLFYSWKKNGNADHVGVVAQRDGKSVQVLEGNKSNTCGYRPISLPYPYALAFVRPNYDEEETPMIEPSKWAKESWEKAKKKKGRDGVAIIDGTYPQNSLTREQMVVILDRLGLMD